ncbi:hypothetical protein [Pseudomonas sp. S3_A03]
MTLITVTKKLFAPCALALALGGISLPALGFVENITAVFRPDPTNPMSNKFKNTTPQSGLCPLARPGQVRGGQYLQYP